MTISECFLLKARVSKVEDQNLQRKQAFFYQSLVEFNSFAIEEDRVDYCHYMSSMKSCSALHAKQNRFLHEFYPTGRLPDLLVLWMLIVGA